MIESVTELRAILDDPEGHAVDVRLDPEGSPPGETIRAFYEAPFKLPGEALAAFTDTAPVLHALAVDLADVAPTRRNAAQPGTIVRVDGIDYTINHVEPEPGGGRWVSIILNVAEED